MNYYPDQLRSVAKLIEALNALDREAEGSVTLASRIAVVDSESDETLGYLVDEIGGCVELPAGRERQRLRRRGRGLRRGRRGAG
jgi:hypothetical protein